MLNMEELLFLEPVYKETIWGGTRLARYDYSLKSDHTGEVWCISAHQNGDCKILNGVYQGQTLSEVYKNHRELFGYIKDEKFPILVKFIDATSDLSVQVHPGDEYALQHENSLGKCECWYVLDCLDTSRLVMGHLVESKEEIKELISKNNYLDLLKFIDIQPEEMYWIPEGTLHAILEGCLIYEIQQSSDITYRVYDYDRMDEKGNKRELHINKALDVISFPDKCEKISPTSDNFQGVIITHLLNKPLFNAKKYVINGTYKTTEVEPMRLVTVLNGSGLANGRIIKKGMSFIVTSQCEKLSIEGELTLIETTLGNNYRK